MLFTLRIIQLRSNNISIIIPGIPIISLNQGGYKHIARIVHKKKMILVN
jgi:hypothetical protein